jgi:hypothetical protein
MLHSRTPESLTELLEVPADLLTNVDVARMNLLCSVGLPGVPYLDVTLGCRILDEWAQHIGQVTESQRHLLVDHGDVIEHSEPLWRLYCLGKVLGDQLGIIYCEVERDYRVEADWKQSNRHFVQGILGPERHGTCSSLPVLVTAIGRRLGYPMKLVHSPGHVFSRWDGMNHPNPRWRERRNFEFNGDCDSRPDAHYYHSPVKWAADTFDMEQRRRIPLYLRSLTPAEELASFLAQRGHAFEAHESFDEAMTAYVTASQLAPHVDTYLYFSEECDRRHLDHILKAWDMTASDYRRLVEKQIRGQAIEFPWAEHNSPLRNPQTRDVLLAAAHVVSEQMEGTYPDLPEAMKWIIQAANGLNCDPASADQLDYFFSCDVSELFSATVVTSSEKE